MKIEKGDCQKLADRFLHGNKEKKRNKKQKKTEREREREREREKVFEIEQQNCFEIPC
jgi:hypothetical protein